MFDAIVSLLPAKVQPYAKTIVAVLGVIVGTVVDSLDEVPPWLTLAVAILTALGVYAAPNKDPRAERQAESVQPPDAPRILGKA